MEKLTIQSLNTLFSHLNDQPASVLWIRSNDYQRQLYVSSHYESIWGRKVDQLYESPDSFMETLLPNSEDNVYKKIHDRIENNQANNNEQVLYRIVTPNNEIRFIKDVAYLLIGENKETVGFAGIAQVISETEWLAELQRNKNASAQADPQEHLKNYVKQILQNELRLSVLHANSMRNQQPHQSRFLFENQRNPVDLTPKEIECLTLLLAGKSAKQTASIMNISTRTVEFHLDNIKNKANCRTKIELLSKTKEVVSESEK